MKKLLLLAAVAGAALGAAQPAQAQLGLLVRSAVNVHTLATRPSAADRQAAKDQANGLAASTYNGQQFRTQRTPADKLPKKGAEQITSLETELTRCHAALEASPTATICTPEQRAALQQQMLAVARSGQTQNLPVYQEEAAFYLAEDARRQGGAAK